MKELMARASQTTVRSTVIVLSVIFCFVFMGSLLFKEIPPNNKDIVNILGGTLIGTVVGSVYGYLFGQSKMTDKKQDINQ